nr:extracellular solute-binding protein [Lachnospiraceae bacterium]
MHKLAKKIMCLGLACAMAFSFTACGGEKEKALNTTGETITLRILENDTAKKEGYFDELLAAFNEAYKDQNIVAVDADMDEYSDLAQNGPYGYGPDVLYQANDILMRYAEDKHILPLTLTDYECTKYIPEAAWDAFKINLNGTTYTCGIPVNIQEPMFFYVKERLPEDYKEKWDDNKNDIPDFLENFNDLYAYSKYLRDTDTSANKDSKYGFMFSFNDLYMNGEFLFSYGAYVFGENEDGTLNSADIGLAKGNAANGLYAMKQFAYIMNEGCIDDTITSNRYEKLANGTYAFAVSTPDTYVLFYNKLALYYEEQGLSKEEAAAKAKENLVMTELPSKMPADGDLTKDAAGMKDSDWVNTVVMGGVNGYGISSYTEHKEACIAFVNFATSYEMIELRKDMLGIAPTRSDVAEKSGGVTEMIFKSLAEGRIYIMPSIKALNQVWTP